jgi:hypothetical protein
MVRHYIPRKPTAQQKEAAHEFYDNRAAAESTRPDLPMSDLDLFFRREAGLDEPQKRQLQRAIERDPDLEPQYREVAEQVRCRPSRSERITYASGSAEPAVLAADDRRYVADSFNGKLTGRDSILRFVRAGNATLTIVSRVTGTRFTYKFQRPKEWEPSPQRHVAPVFCKVMTGSDNEADFEFVGTMWPEDNALPDGPQVYRHGRSARIGLSAPSVRALVWFLRTALHPLRSDALEQCEVWHEGRCGRCGRKLTVPASVASGYGPECEGKM